MYTFTSNTEDSPCTLILNLKNCIKVEIADEYLYKQNTFSIKEKNCCYYFKTENSSDRSEWIRTLKIAIGNVIIIDEKDEYECEVSIITEKIVNSCT